MTKRRLHMHRLFSFQGMSWMLMNQPLPATLGTTELEFWRNFPMLQLRNWDTERQNQIFRSISVRATPCDGEGWFQKPRMPILWEPSSWNISPGAVMNGNAMNCGSLLEILAGCGFCKPAHIEPCNHWGQESLRSHPHLLLLLPATPWNIHFPF